MKKKLFVLVLVAFWVMVTTNVLASKSGQSLIDSLKKELKSVKNDSVRANFYYNIAYNYDMIDPKVGASYARKAIALADSLGYRLEKAWGLNALAINLVELSDYPAANSAYQQSLQLFDELGKREPFARVLVNRGTLFKTQSLYPDALDCYQQALDVFKSLGKEIEVASIMVNIGNIYGGLGDNASAITYFVDALDQIGSEGNPTARAVLEGNLAVSYHDLGQDSLAEMYYNRSLKAHQELGNTGWEAMTWGNKASMRYNQNRYVESAEMYQRALDIYRKLELESYISWILTELGLVELDRDNVSKSIEFCTEALDIAKSIQSLDEELHACACMARGLEQLGNYKEAAEMHKRYIALNDSVESQKEHDEIVRMMMERAFNAQMKVDSLQREEEQLKTELRHNKEIHQKNNQRNLSIFIGLIVVLLAGGLWGRLRYTRHSKKRIEEEKEVSEKLLLNILPAEVADELKQHGRSKAQKFEDVTVMFTDFKGFTKIASQLNAEALVAEIGHCFGGFDEIVGKYGLEKIKTIGDAYMAAGGLPVPTEGAAKKTVSAALEMQAFIHRRKIDNAQQGKPAFDMRVGIHSGPVVAGIVGTKKFQYDIWGDTVNTASRMESSGEAGQVNISEATYELVKNRAEFMFTSRGKIEAKGKGELEMYFVEKASSG